MAVPGFAILFQLMIFAALLEAFGFLGVDGLQLEPEVGGDFVRAARPVDGPQDLLIDAEELGAGPLAHGLVEEEGVGHSLGRRFESLARSQLAC